MSLPFDNSYARLPARFYERIAPTPVKSPRVVAFNKTLALDLGLSLELFEDARAAEYLSGNVLWPGSEPLALAYAGHQFGGFSPKLGDGRAHLLGEISTEDGQRYDIQLKGSGPTAFSRGGDGRAALGPVLREYLVSESMHALGVPTTRALAAVTTGEPVHRDTVRPGAILTRVAGSHLRVGTFEYFGDRGDTDALKILVDYALTRHFSTISRDSETSQSPFPAAHLLDCVITAQAQLIAHWMGLGFVHGVMNTDNCTISGETIDYGPCAFLDAFDPSRTFSSIDRGGRYAFAQQPMIAQWNLARLAEALLPLLGSDESQAVSTATDLLHQFPERYDAYRTEISARKLGVTSKEQANILDRELNTLMAAEKADFTCAYYSLRKAVRGDSEQFLTLFPKEPHRAQAWLDRYRDEQKRESASGRSGLETMNTSNPLYIPRNLLVEDVLESAEEGELEPFFRLLSAVQAPYIEVAELADLARPPGAEQWSHVTFCGT